MVHIQRGFGEVVIHSRSDSSWVPHFGFGLSGFNTLGSKQNSGRVLLPLHLVGFAYMQPLFNHF